MNRVREALARHREELLDRWNRQLRAAADAGFALDEGTADVLRRLLDAADRALHHRFAPIPAGTPPAAARARRAALQCSLVGEFVFDVALEKLPQMSALERRRLADALVHAAVEVQVEAALERESERRRRDAARLARLAHDLRNLVTAARLALDLLRRRGDIPASRAGRLLEESLSRLRDSIEDTLLDEALSAGGLRTVNVRLAPVLADARSVADALGAGEKNVNVVLEEPICRVSIRADPRVVRPAVHGLLRAALQIARPGATIRVAAAALREKARVAVAVQGCRRLPGNRLPDLPALALARRAARLQGGFVIARRARSDSCEFRLALPRVRHH
jgi:signal transduction histidine kinase